MRRRSHGPARQACRGHPLLRRRSARRSHRLTSAVGRSHDVAKARKSSGKSTQKRGGAQKSAARRRTASTAARKGGSKKAAARKTAGRKTAKKGGRKASARK